tara:strand:+ start:17 stop:313 length:297 start_codon:yes stop_codon:yes gene_type:complete
MAFKMRSPFKNNDKVTSNTTVTRKNNKKNSTTNTNINSNDGSSSNIKKSTTTNKKGKVEFNRSILKTDAEGNVTSTVTRGNKVKTYKGKRAVRKHKRV